MSTSVISLADSFAANFKRTEVIGRMLWCRAAAMHMGYICAQEQPRLSPDDVKQGIQPKWKIAMLRVEQFDQEGHPISVRHVGYISARVAPVMNGRQLDPRVTDTFNYDDMMGLMKQYYSPSTPDPMERLSGHIKEELRIWEKAKRDAEITARAEAVQPQARP